MTHASAPVALLLDTDPGAGFDGPKLLAPFSGIPLVERVVGAARRWPVGGVVVVLGPDGEEVAGKADLGDAVVVIDLEWEEGEAAQLRAGLDAIQRLDLGDSALVSYADMPGVSPDVAEALVARERRRPIITPVYRYAPGPPHLVAEELWPRLMGLEGRASIATLIKTHPEWVDEVWFSHLAPQRVHTPHDLDHVPHG